MKKIAKLVRISLVTRVVVNEDATEQEIMETAIPKLSETLMTSPFECIDEIVDDLECPVTKNISQEDIETVAENINFPIKKGTVDFVLTNYESEATSDPTGCLPFWIENLLYRSLTEL